MSKSLSYANAGVNYKQIDPLKLLAQSAAADTASNLDKHKMTEWETSRGESAYVVEQGKNLFAFVQEGLGTKNLVADAMFKLTGKNYYANIAQDTIAMIVNDLVTVGARPAIISAYWAVGNSEWLQDKDRIASLVNGWRDTCNDIGATWGGGETPVLKDIIAPGTIDLAGHCFGVINSREQLVIEDNLKAGDRIITFSSSGIHANGLTLARKIADQLPGGYMTKLPSGRTYGDALLKPTIIYSNVISAIQDAGIRVNYLTNITGHGWRKFMRAKKEFTYRINAIPSVPDVLKFIVEKGKLDIKEAYSNLNMGAGFALFISQDSVHRVLEIAKSERIPANVVGVVESGTKQLIIEPLGLRLDGDSLQVR